MAADNKPKYYLVEASVLPEIFAKEYGLAIGNGAHYGKQAEGYMRLNIGCARGILQKGLDQMAKMYADYINK